MRVLHTSDWHLGRVFHGASLLDEQAQAMSRLVEVVRSEGVELVVVAGDLYDRSVPPADAVALFDQTLAELHRAGASVVAISGNHDSAVRVGFAEQLLGKVGVTLRGDAARTGQAVVVPVDDGGPPLRLYPIPFLDPLSVAHLARADRRDEQTDDHPADRSTDLPPVPRRFTHHDAMAWAMDRVRADLSAAGPARSVVVAHTFVTGGEPSASERDLSLGHVEQVGLSVFDGIDYVALGHLHRRQRFDGGRITYSGSPLRYSFSEQDNTPSVQLVDLDPTGGRTVEQVPLGVGRPMCTLTGTLQSLLDQPDLDHARDAWVRVVLTDRQLPLQAMRRLQQRFPHAVELSHEPDGIPAPTAAAGSSAAVRRADPLELTSRFLVSRRGIELDVDEAVVLADSVEQVLTGTGPS
jgi:exonuclease SbcD